MNKILIVFASCLAIAAAFNIDGSSSSEEDHVHGSRGRGRGDHYGGGDGGYNDGGRNKKTHCGEGWKYFDRPSGGWCIKVEYGLFQKHMAEARCNAYGATLSGLQNEEEIKYINREQTRVIPTLRGHAWVGGIRTAACVGKPQGGPCTAKTAFQWTDHSTTGTEGFVFSIGQPSNIQLGQDCLLLWNAEIPVYQNAQPGLMITWSCVATTPLINSYVCGKKAT